MARPSHSSPGPEGLAWLVENELELLGQRPPVPLRVYQAWSSAVGPQIAQRSRPGRLKGRTLVVTVASSVWMNELQLLGPAILERLGEQLGVEELRFEIGPLPRVAPGAVRSQRGPSQPPARAARSGPLPAAIADALARVKDPALRERIAAVLARVIEE